MTAKMRHRRQILVSSLRRAELSADELNAIGRPDLAARKFTGAMGDMPVPMDATPPTDCVNQTLAWLKSTGMVKLTNELGSHYGLKDVAEIENLIRDANLGDGKQTTNDFLNAQAATLWHLYFRGEAQYLTAVYGSATIAGS